MRTSLALLGLLLAGAPAAFAAEAGGKESREEVTDQFIEARKAEFDETWRKASDEAEKRFSEAVKFHTEMKDARLSFEKEAIEKRKSFLDSLKGMKPEQRRGSWKEFAEAARSARRAFREGQQAKREAFHKQMREERSEFREEAHKKRQEMKEERRNEHKKMKDQRREQKEGQRKGR